LPAGNPPTQPHRFLEAPFSPDPTAPDAPPAESPSPSSPTPPPARRGPRFGPATALQLVQLARFGVQLMAGVALARWVGNGPLLAGYESLLLAANLFSFVWFSALPNWLLPSFGGASAAIRPQVIRAALRTSHLAGLLSGALAALYLAWGTDLDAQTLLACGAFVTFSVAALPGDFALFLGRRYRAMWLYGSTTALLQGLAAVVPAYMGGDFADTALALMAAAVVRYLTGTVMLQGYVRQLLAEVDGTGRPASAQAETLKALTLKLWPLLGVALFAGLAEPLDAALIRAFFDEADFVLFRYGARELPIATILAAGFSAAWSARIAEAQKEGKLGQALYRLRRTTIPLMDMLFLLALVLMYGAPYLFEAVYGPDFAGSATVFQGYLLLTCSRLLFPQAIVLGLQRGGLMFRVALAELLLHVGLSVAFLPVFGPMGVVYATVTAYAFEKVLLIYQLHRMGLGPQYYVPLGRWVLYSAALVLAYVAEQMR